ncbi:hypothetical protein GJ496_008171 [Pomphorhynchus laevis]|nr:hypothetical protein GJ496_008171 [Pomphorhynchus laevis]
MAVGALSADAILHLLPNALGLHNHNDNETDSHKSSEQESLHYVLIFSTVLIGIYAFYIIDLLVDNLIKQLHQKSHKRDNSICENISFENRTEIQDIPICDCERPNAEASIVRVFKNSKGIGHMCRKSVVCIKEITAYVWCLLLADSIHNLADGLVLGAAFAKSLNLGLSTSIAVLFHELPHELGDYAIMIKSGLSKKQSLVLNLVTGFTAFIGFFIGAVISRSQQSTMPWILALTAGMFLYVALCGIQPEVVSTRKRCTLFMQVTTYLGGITIGMVLMIILALVEEDLHSIIGHRH